MSDQIIEFQKDQRQQIRESEILSQEFMQQLIMQQREDDVRERERDFFLELSKILFSCLNIHLECTYILLHFPKLHYSTFCVNFPAVLAELFLLINFHHHHNNHLSKIM